MGRLISGFTATVIRGVIKREVWEHGMTLKDSDGNDLFPPRDKHEKLQYKPVWAVYQVRDGYHSADSRQTDFADLATARNQAEGLNAERDEDAGYRYSVFRVVLAPAGRRSPRKPGRVKAGR